jgi:hypothetical protein
MADCLTAQFCPHPTNTLLFRCCMAHVIWTFSTAMKDKITQITWSQMQSNHIRSSWRPMGRFITLPTHLPGSYSSTKCYVSRKKIWRHTIQHETNSMEHSPSWDANASLANQEIPHILWNPYITMSSTVSIHRPINTKWGGDTADINTVWKLQFQFGWEWLLS